MGNKGKLFLIPTAIAVTTTEVTVPPYVLERLSSIRDFLAEDVRTARRYLSSLKIFQSIESLNFSVLDTDTTPDQLEGLLTAVFDRPDVVMLSESGCPEIAHPGPLAVAYAHANRIRVIPLAGPSPIV